MNSDAEVKVPWRCRVMDWHKISEFVGFDGCSAHARCARCGGTGLVDSSGSLFAVKYPQGGNHEQ